MELATEKMALARLPPIGSTQAEEISPRHTKQYGGLTGPSYHIGKHKYALPPPNVLKPYQDTRAGTLDTWPAHCTGQASSDTSVAITKNKQLVVIDDEAQGKPKVVPKPKFLDQLEGFLKKELRALGVDKVHPSDLRLQAHREVFEYMIEDFKTYKPLLSAIKNEYEMMIAYQRQQIRQMEPLKQMLVTVSEQCDQKIVALRDQEKQEMVDLKTENKRLYFRIDELRQEQITLQSQVEKLQEELAAEYLRYRDECDSRKLLISDINDLRYQQEDMLMGKKSMEEEEKEDPVTLKIALKKAREDEAKATQRLNEMEANYGDVIPRRDFETLQKNYQAQEEKIEIMKSDFNQLKEEHETLIEQYKQVLQQRDDYYIECDTLRRSATPRPEWDKCADFITGGNLRWTEISEGKTSDQLVDILLNEISGSAGPDAGGAEYFDGQGTGDSVPKYLRYEGRIRNRRLGKRDCALLVRDIWREKGAHDTSKSDGKRESLPEFLHLYLQRRFGLETMVMEWAYNLHDACQRYCHDPNIGLFFKALTGEADEELYHVQLQTVAKLLNQLTKLDIEKGNQGELTKDDFKEVLKEYFGGEDEERLLSLMQAAEVEMDAKDSDSLEYKNLFMEDDEGKTGPFLEEVKKQINNERYQYVDDIKGEIGSANPVNAEALKVAILGTDPEVDPNSLNSYLLWAFNVKSEADLSSAEPIEQSSLISRLQNGNLKRIGKKN